MRNKEITEEAELFPIATNRSAVSVAVSMNPSEVRFGLGLGSVPSVGELVGARGCAGRISLSLAWSCFQVYALCSTFTAMIAAEVMMIDGDDDDWGNKSECIALESHRRLARRR